MDINELLRFLLFGFAIGVGLMGRAKYLQEERSVVWKGIFIGIPLVSMFALYCLFVADTNRAKSVWIVVLTVILTGGFAVNSRLKKFDRE